MTAYHRFIRDNGITSGIIVADKGFPAQAAASAFAENPNLHYLNPVRRNSKYIETHGLHHYERGVEGREGLLCKKAKVEGKDKWLYSYRDSAKAAKEEMNWLRRTEEFSDEKLKSKQPAFGTIVLECDLDLTPEEVYKAYVCRWEIELVMRYYKPTLELDETRVHDDYSVIGTEFIDFISSTVTMRMLRDMDQSGLFCEMSYKKIMSILRRAKKVRLSPETEWQYVKINPSQEEVLRKLKLLPTIETQSSANVADLGKHSPDGLYSLIVWETIN